MKKIILILVGLALIAKVTFSQTAVNFTVNDCNGNSTDLFSQLDAGKVVVMVWVMPCGACISVAANVNTVVQGYASSNPGEVLYYLVDDYANTSCSSLSSWASTNGISVDACFASSDIAMSDYGTEAMQKTVVLGGTNHEVYFNDEGSISSSSMQSAIDDALATTASIRKAPKSDFQLSVFPNPATDKLFLSYSIKQDHNVILEITNVMGERIIEIENENQTIGQNKMVIDVKEFTTGIYFLKIHSENLSQLVKFNVLH